MKRTKVVVLVSVRDMLTELDNMRRFILSGRAAGLQTCMQADDGEEQISLTGSYQQRPEAAVRAIHKAALLRPTQHDETNPGFRPSRRA